MALAESQNSLDFRAAAFLAQNISTKVFKLRFFVIFGKGLVWLFFLLFVLSVNNILDATSYIISLKIAVTNFKVFISLFVKQNYLKKKEKKCIFPCGNFA